MGKVEQDPNPLVWTSLVLGLPEGSYRHLVWVVRRGPGRQAGFLLSPPAPRVRRAGDLLSDTDSAGAVLTSWFVPCRGRRWCPCHLSESLAPGWAVQGPGKGSGWTHPAGVSALLLCPAVLSRCCVLQGRDLDIPLPQATGPRAGYRKLLCQVTAEDKPVPHYRSAARRGFAVCSLAAHL